MTAASFLLRSPFGVGLPFLEGSGEAVLQTYREKVKMSVSFMEQSVK